MNPCDLYCLLIFMTFLSGTSGARLTASPSQITIGGSSPTSQLTVSCRPDAPGITQVFTIVTGKKSSTGSDQPIIQMTTRDSSVQVVDTSLQQRMTASGSIGGATSSIQFILTDLRCADAASTYYCTTLYFAGSGGSDEATINITSRTYPEQIEMFPTPDRLQYDDGQLISFRCTGRIGNQFDDNNLQNLWTWEWRSIDTEFTTWTRYYSSNKTVNVVVQQPPQATTPSEKPACATCVQENQEPSFGVGVAIGVCVMLVVDAICLGLAFVFRNKLANCISGPKDTSNAEKPVFSNLQAPATVMAPVGIQTQGLGDEYEVPVDRNDYDALQREAADVPNTYEKIRTYQNV